MDHSDGWLSVKLTMTESVHFTEDYRDPLGDEASDPVAMGWNPPGLVGGDAGLHQFIV